MIKQLRIWWLRRQLNAVYRAYLGRFDAAEAGWGVTADMDPHLRDLSVRANNLLGKLERLDHEGYAGIRLREQA